MTRKAIEEIIYGVLCEIFDAASRSVEYDAMPTEVFDKAADLAWEKLVELSNTDEE